MTDTPTLDLTADDWFDHADAAIRAWMAAERESLDEFVPADFDFDDPDYVSVVENLVNQALGHNDTGSLFILPGGADGFVDVVVDGSHVVDGFRYLLSVVSLSTPEPLLRGVCLATPYLDFRDAIEHRDSTGDDAIFGVVLSAARYFATLSAQCLRLIPAA